MAKVSQDAQHLGKVIAEAINGPNWPSISTMIITALATALISWAGAYVIAKLVAGWEKQETARATAAALHSEIYTIFLLLDEFASTKSPYTDVTVDRIRNDSRFCSVYLSSASGVGYLPGDVVDDVVAFYSSVLVLKDGREVVRSGKTRLVMDRRDIVTLCELAEIALSRIEEQYKFKRRERPKSFAEGVG